MNRKTSPIIEVKELFDFQKSENLIIVDASNGKNSKENYYTKHLDKAIFIDLNLQLADAKNDFANGGRHPLPKIAQFAKTLKNSGIKNKSHVVIYDDKNGSNAAARFWWMLKSIGHENVQVLNGGFQQAEKLRYPINSNFVVPEVVENYKFDKWKLATAEINEVEENLFCEKSVLIDVRESSRFLGKIEPIDLIAGHIPGAINSPFSLNLDGDGMFLHPKILKNNYSELFGNKNSKNIIVHCGSGVTACHTLLAIDYAGLQIPKLYVGSWSEWSRSNKKIVQEK